MTMPQLVDDVELDEMTEVIGQLRELAHSVAHARAKGDTDAIYEGLNAMDTLFRATDSTVLAAALLERLFAADWAACQNTDQLPHLLP